MLGLGWSSLSVLGMVPVFDRMIEQELINDAVFSFYLSKDPAKQGELILGGYNQARIKGEVSWFDLSHDACKFLN